MSWATHESLKWTHFYTRPTTGHPSLCGRVERPAEAKPVGQKKHGQSRADWCPSCSSILNGARTLDEAQRRATKELIQLGLGVGVLTTGPAINAQKWQANLHTAATRLQSIQKCQTQEPQP